MVSPPRIDKEDSMKKSRFTESQIIGILKEVEATHTGRSPVCSLFIEDSFRGTRSFGGAAYSEEVALRMAPG